MDIPELNSYLPLLELAWREDFQYGDITSEATLPEDLCCEGKLVAREAGVMAGVPVVMEVLKYYDKRLAIEVLTADCQRFGPGQVLARLSGNTRSMLAAERVVLNFLQRLCAIATLTDRYVQLVKHTQAKICDTRKTTPGWRTLEKYAVRCGGGTNHRFSLSDAVLVKDNHLAALSGVSLREKLSRMCENVRKMARRPDFIEVEVDTLQQLEEVLTVDGIDIVLLDNMTTDQMAQAVQMRDKKCPSDRTILLEASGGVNFTTVVQIAETGVDRISIGALTHSVRNLDIALDM